MHAARALELREGHQGTPVYSNELLVSESPARRPLRLLSKCRFSVDADIVKAHPALKQLPVQGITLAVYQLSTAGPAAYLPAQVKMSRVEPVSILQDKSSAIAPALRPLLCVVADADGDGKNAAGFDALEKFLGAEEQLGFLVLRTIETQACQNNQTSTFKREREEIIALYSNASKLGKQHFSSGMDERLVISCKHLRAAFVSMPNGKSHDAINM